MQGAIYRRMYCSPDKSLVVGGMKVKEVFVYISTKISLRLKFAWTRFGRAQFVRTQPEFWGGFKSRLSSSEFIY